MGSYQIVETSIILPSQNFLKENTVRFIFSCIEQNNLGDLPPTPIVRAVPDSTNYVAIDGHNLIAVKDYLGQDIEVYVAEHREDYLEDDGDAVAARNQDLHDKFEGVLETAETMANKGINSFADLEIKYPELFAARQK